MNKHFVHLLALCALCMGLAACGSDGDESPVDGDEDPTTEEQTPDDDDSSPADGQTVARDAAIDAGSSRSDSGTARVDAATTRVDAGDDDGDDDDGDDDDDDGDAPTDAARPGAKDAGAGSDAGKSGDAAAADAAMSTADASGPTKPNTGNLTRTVVNATIIVKSGETFDGTGKRFVAGSALGDGSQDEGQQPVFRFEDGAKAVNITLGGPAADGIHTYGDVTLENIVWEDIGEDAMTIKESGTVVLNGGSATNGDDKVFQVNAASTFRISNFKASHAGKFIRQNGGTKFKVEVFIDKCDISNMDEAVFRTDSSSSTVSFTNSRYSKIGDSLFVGVSSGNIKQSNNTEY